MRLAGAYVLNTRPAQQAGGLTTMLRSEGAEVLECPLIEFKQIPIDEGGRERLSKLGEQSIVVCTSANGIRMLPPELVRLLRGKRAAAIGEQTAAALRAAELDVVHVNEESSSEAFGNDLSRYARSAGILRCVLVRGGRAGPVLEERLRGEGFQVDVVISYTGVAAAIDPAVQSEVLSGLRGARRFDAVVVTSSDAVNHFRAAFAGVDLGRRTAIKNGPKTAETAREAGFGNVRIAEAFSDRGICDALIEHRAQVRG